jgi:hypothetical protein
MKMQEQDRVLFWIFLKQGKKIREATKPHAKDDNTRPDMKPRKGARMKPS